MSYKILLVGSLVLLALGLSIAVVDAQRPPPGGRRSPTALAGTAFTYQGQLKNNGALVNGSCDLAFRLYDDASAGTLVGSPITQTIPITNGLFTTQLDFGANAFTGDSRWLDLQVRCPTGVGGFTALSPRQPLTPAPYALALPGLYTQQDATSPNVIGGYSGNTVIGGVHGATIGGGGQFGFPNQVSAHYGTIGGGWNNTAGGLYATVGGGLQNSASKFAATIGGGQVNNASRDFATIGGGVGNGATMTYTTVGGGYGNSASAISATVGGGSNNIANGSAATVSGGYNNTVTLNGLYATIGGGISNTVSGYAAKVGGGWNNISSGSSATIGGGNANSASGDLSTIGGGSSNIVSGDWATIGGGVYNIASGKTAFVGGGGFVPGFFGGNVASGNASTIGGGFGNSASYTTTTVGGGWGNNASNWYATVGGGSSNTASGESATIGGGAFNAASGESATIGGGAFNAASGFRATIGGGEHNTASGTYATIGGGFLNTAAGTYSFAAGRQAIANHQGAFVWADSNTVPFTSTATNQFSARATGGARLVSAVDAFGNPTAGVQLASGGGAWSSISDRAAKDNFYSVNGRDMLARLSEIPIQTWNYKTQDASIRHIGPMAQDFYAAFNVGEDDKHITTVDADGVALAAIQGLYQVVQDEIKSRDAKIAAQQKQIDALEARVAALEQGDPKGLGDSSGLGSWNAAIALVIGALGVVAFERARRGGAR